MSGDLPLLSGARDYSNQYVVTNHPLSPPLLPHRILARISSTSSTCRIRGCFCSIFWLDHRDKGLGSTTGKTRNLLGDACVQIKHVWNP